MNAHLIQQAMWGAALLAALGFATGAGIAKLRKRATRHYMYALAGAGVVALGVVPAIGIVPPGQRGVVYEWGGGISPQERGEGVTLLVPWVQTMRTMNVRTRKLYSAKVFSQSLDLQEITVVASVNYHVDPNLAAELYQRVGPLYPSTVIQPALFQRTKAAVGRIKAEDFASRRAWLAGTVRKQLTAQLAEYGIVIEYVNVEDAIFDKKFIKAVQNKIVAEQRAAEERRNVEVERAIKQQRIIKAEATARAIRIEATAQAKANRAIAASLGAEVLRWKWLTAWDGIMPQTLVVGDNRELGLLLGTEVYP